MKDTTYATFSMYSRQAANTLLMNTSLMTWVYMHKYVNPFHSGNINRF